MSGIREFFVVTKSGSVYHVYADETGKQAIIEKVASASDGGLDIGTLFEGGTHAGITDFGLTLYPPKYRDGKPRPAGEINILLWGGTTSQIVSLFLRREQAEKCVESSDLAAWDARWAAETQETRDAIGSDHALFILDEKVASGQA